MDPPKSIHLNKVIQKTTSNDDIKYYIYMQSKWFKDSVELLLQSTYTKTSYKAKLFTNAIKESASELEIPYEEFYDECRNALITHIALPGFEYEIDTDEKLFKLIKKQEFNIQYIEVRLEEANISYHMLDTAIALIDERQKHDSEKAEHSREQNYDTLLKEFQTCVEEKNNLENKLLQKFVVILNSKKEKIVELKRRIQQLEKQNGDNSSMECKPIKSRKLLAENIDLDDQPSTSHSLR